MLNTVLTIAGHGKDSVTQYGLKSQWRSLHEITRSDVHSLKVVVLECRSGQCVSDGLSSQAGPVRTATAQQTEHALNWPGCEPQTFNVAQKKN